MPESTALAYCFVQFLNQVQVSLLYSTNNKLGHSVSTLNDIRFRPQVDQSNFNFTTIISINGSRTVYDCHAVA